MVEKRVLRRRNLIYNLQVTDRDSNEPMGRLVDITAEGLMIIRESPLTAGKLYSLRIALPEKLLGKTHIDLDASSIWSRPDINDRYFDVGFQLVPGFCDTEAIVALVLKYGMDGVRL